MKSLFITGASGFVGRHLVERLDASQYENVFCLSRRGVPAVGVSPPANIKYIRASLAETALYVRELAESATVVHLAAAMGKALPADHFQTNVTGTRALVEQCRRLGVARFLHVSTIAVGFPDKRRYTYAQSKQQAEEIVRAGGIRFTIVRPTIVLGAGAPTWAGLARLARMPVIPVFGDGKAAIQPIYVTDLAGLLKTILDRDLFAGDTFDLGGPQALSVEEFLKRAHRRLRGGAPRTIHVPLWLVVPPLTVAEYLFYSRLPVTIGQLASFRMSGVAQPNALLEESWPKMKSVDEMLDLLCAHDR